MDHIFLSDPMLYVHKKKFKRYKLTLNMIDFSRMQNPQKSIEYRDGLRSPFSLIPHALSRTRCLSTLQEKKKTTTLSIDPIPRSTGQLAAGVARRE